MSSFDESKPVEQKIAESLKRMTKKELWRAFHLAEYFGRRNARRAAVEKLG